MDELKYAAKLMGRKGGAAKVPKGFSNPVILKKALEARALRDAKKRAVATKTERKDS